MTDLDHTAIAELCLVAMALGFLGFIAAMMAKDIYTLEVPRMITCPDCGMQLPDAKTLETHVYERQCEFTPDGDVRLLQALAAGADRPNPTRVFARVLLRLEKGTGWLRMPTTNVPFQEVVNVSSEHPLGTSYTHHSQNPVDR